MYSRKSSAVPMLPLARIGRAGDEDFEDYFEELRSLRAANGPMMVPMARLGRDAPMVPMARMGKKAGRGKGKGGVHILNDQVPMSKFGSSVRSRLTRFPGIGLDNLDDDSDDSYYYFLDRAEPTDDVRVTDIIDADLDQLDEYDRGLRGGRIRLTRSEGKFQQIPMPRVGRDVGDEDPDADNTD